MITATPNLPIRERVAKKLAQIAAKKAAANRLAEIQAEIEAARIRLAAPDLLAALEALVKMCVRGSAPDHEFICCITPGQRKPGNPTWAAFDAARAAIKKAKGVQ